MDNITLWNESWLREVKIWIPGFCQLPTSWTILGLSYKLTFLSSEGIIILFQPMCFEVQSKKYGKTLEGVNYYSNVRYHYLLFRHKNQVRWYPVGSLYIFLICIYIYFLPLFGFNMDSRSILEPVLVLSCKIKQKICYYKIFK